MSNKLIPKVLKKRIYLLTQSNFQTTAKKKKKFKKKENIPNYDNLLPTGRS